MITSADPDWLNTDTWPDEPSFTVTAFGITSPATQFKLDAVGWVAPVGHTDRYDAEVVSATVTFNTTESALAGTPPRPPTVTVRTIPVVHGLEYPPVLPGPGRESNTRAGDNAWNDEPVGTDGVTGADEADAGPVPTAFVAFTLNVYAVPFARPVKSHVKASTFVHPAGGDTTGDDVTE